MHSHRNIAPGLALLALLAPLARVAAQQGAPGVTVSGVVYDSIARAPLAEANVQLIRADSTSPAERKGFFATSDARGQFRLDSVPPGTYLAGFFHPMLDSLGLQVPGRQVTVRERDARVDLAIPSATRVTASICGEATPSDSAGALIGFVRDAATGAPRGDAELSVRWVELVLEQSQLRRATPEVKAHTSSAGWFAVCRLPARMELLARATEGADTSGVVPVQVEGRGITHADFFVGHSEPAPREAPVATGNVEADSLARVEVAAAPAPRRGHARLVGTVRSSTGQPLAGARVSVWETSARGVTNDTGAFALAELPAGSHTLEARAIGYVPARATVQLREGGEAPTRATITLLNLRAYLDTIRVSTTRIFSRDRNGFEARRRRGVGHFMDRAEIERHLTTSTANLLAPIPNVVVTPGRSGSLVRFRDHWANFCTPWIIIDGVRIPPEPGSLMATTPLDLLVTPDDIEQIEVYSRDTETPAEYASLSGCGTIVIWTRLPDPKPVKPQ